MSPLDDCPHPHQVLVVDDNDDVRDAFVTLLSMEGFTVESAAGVEDALGQLRDGRQPCVVLLDLHMPDLDGWTLVDFLGTEADGGETPVVIVSGDGREREQAAARGVTFLQKPVDGQTLVDAVTLHCRK